MTPLIRIDTKEGTWLKSEFDGHAVASCEERLLYMSIKVTSSTSRLQGIVVAH